MTTRSISLAREKLFDVAPNPDARFFLFTLIVAVAVIAPALLYGIPDNRDLNNHLRFALPFYESLRSGHLYPGWLAESTGGYGDPSFRFYPPTFYYLLSFARSLTGNWYSATLLSFAALSLVGSVGNYFWVRSISSAQVAMWSAVLFLLAPYHLNELYQATLLAEFAACAVLPFAFWSLEVLCRSGSRKSVAAFAGSYALLVLTHLPLAVIGSLGLFVYATVRVGFKDWRAIMRLGIGTLLGLIVSAFYWVTMVSELRWIGINNVTRDASVDYRLNFLFSTFSADNLNVWWMNIIGGATLLFFAPALILIRKRGQKLLPMAPALVLAFFSFLMATPVTRAFWQILKPLQEVQFPWRWLTLFSLAGSFVVARSFCLWRNVQTNVGRVARTLAFGAVAIAVAFTLSHVVREAQFLSATRFEATLSAVRGTDSVNYWIPIWAKASPTRMSQPVEAIGRDVVVERWDPEDRAFSIAQGSSTEVRVRTFYYPHWKASSSGQELATRPDQDGALLISVPTEATSVSLRFVEPVRTRASTAASALGLLLIVALASPIRGKQSECKA